MSVELPGRTIRIKRTHPLTSAEHGIDNTGKLHKHTVARRLDDAATMLSENGIEEDASDRFQSRQRSFLVGPPYRDDLSIEGGILREECAKLYYGPNDAVRREEQGNV